jgi:hypothetical protein
VGTGCRPSPPPTTARFTSPEAGGLPGRTTTVEHTVEQMVPLDLCWSLRLPLCLLRQRAEAVPVTGTQPPALGTTFFPRYLSVANRLERVLAYRAFCAERALPHVGGLYVLI